MKIDSAKIKKLFKKALSAVWRKIFLALILLLLIDVLIVGLFVWRYYFEREDMSMMARPPLRVNQILINQFAGEWNDNLEHFNKALNKEYLNPF